MCRIGILTALLLALAIIAAADVPQIINYQGRLTDTEGNPVADGPYLIKFKIYGSESGVDSLWSSGFQTVTVTDGLFSYLLGSNVLLPPGIFGPGITPYLGLTVGVDAEINPRTAFTSSAFAIHSNSTDTAAFAANVGDGSITNPKLATYAVTGDKISDNAINSDHIQSGSILLEDLNQNEATSNQVIKWNGSYWGPAADDAGAGGDITGVTAGSGLSGGGTSGTVSLAVAADGITSTHIGAGAVGTSEISDGSITTTDILDGTITGSDIANETITSSDIDDGTISSSDITDVTITDADISASAAIATTKISGTAMNLSTAQTITGSKTFDGGSFYLGDSTMYANSTGALFGTRTVIPSNIRVVGIFRNFDISGDRFGIDMEIENAGGTAVGISSSASTSDAGSTAYGGYYIASGSGNRRGIYASCGSSTGNYGAYFYGNVECTGVYSKSAGGFKIDHPQDPENMYLAHSDVSSPERKNVYDGIAKLDTNGEATIELPSYFEALNENFRYQLTPIGASMPDLFIAQKIEGNRFVVSGGKPYMEVSWQVTGIRKDAFAKAMSTEVELTKNADEKGLYRNPEIFGFGIEKSVDYKHHPEALENTENRQQSE